VDSCARKDKIAVVGVNTPTRHLVKPSPSPVRGPPAEAVLTDCIQPRPCFNQLHPWQPGGHPWNFYEAGCGNWPPSFPALPFGESL